MTRYEAIFRRKSVRKYRWEELDPRLLDAVEHFGGDETCICPDIAVRWKIVRYSDRNMKGPFQVKAPDYVALYSEVKEN